MHILVTHHQNSNSDNDLDNDQNIAGPAALQSRFRVYFRINHDFQVNFPVDHDHQDYPTKLALLLSWSLAGTDALPFRLRKQQRK